MTPKTIKAARPANTIKAPKGFVPMRIKLQRQRKEERLQQQQVANS